MYGVLGFRYCIPFAYSQQEIRTGAVEHKVIANRRIDRLTQRMWSEAAAGEDRFGCPIDEAARETKR